MMLIFFKLSNDQISISIVLTITLFIFEHCIRYYINNIKNKCILLDNITFTQVQCFSKVTPSIAFQTFEDISLIMVFTI